MSEKHTCMNVLSLCWLSFVLKSLLRLGLTVRVMVIAGWTGFVYHNHVHRRLGSAIDGEVVFTPHFRTEHSDICFLSSRLSPSFASPLLVLIKLKHSMESGFGVPSTNICFAQAPACSATSKIFLYTELSSIEPKVSINQLHLKHFSPLYFIPSLQQHHNNKLRCLYPGI